MELGRLPLTYDECRARFRRAAMGAGIATVAHSIAAPGPDGQELTIDVATVGAKDPRRVLLVMSGVHGVEGFAGSALQCDLITALGSDPLPADTAVVVVHAVNPWGMAWWRRQNEQNVDLNRNWRRDDDQPAHNDAYDEIHPLACPDTPTLPTTETLFAAAGDLVAQRGLVWVRDGITMGQYRHPDGLHFGGDRTEESTRIIEELAGEHLGGVERGFVFDLHTGHGPRGEVTFLSDAAPGSTQDEFLHSRFDPARIEPTVDNPAATTGAKSGQIANGIRDLFPEAMLYASSVELGTASDEEQLIATYQEQWVHRRGLREHPDHASVVWAYRCCFTPDDGTWERDALAAGAGQLAAAVRAVAEWS
ncbi:MAG: M14 family metallopeptidase [Actinomycetota bacterium]|nr:DUF2817 domain-containing protein [Acidimicrobiia bacterium]MDQ3293730.1 M14 family metallopeptidase [Actinomycetota bacterium]